MKFVTLPVGQVGQVQFSMTLESLSFILKILKAHFNSILEELCDNNGKRKVERWQALIANTNQVMYEHILAQFFPGDSFTLLKNPAGHTNPKDRPQFIEQRMQYFETLHSGSLFVFFYNGQTKPFQTLIPVTD